MRTHVVKWTTQQEINYLRGIGSHRRIGDGASAVLLLERYIKNMDKRTWDGMDKDKVRKFAERKLKSARGV